MHFPDRRPDQTEERILPLINVVFLLLIFFMIAGSLTVTEPFEVTPPVSQTQAPHEPDTVMILMAAEGQFALDNVSIPEAELVARISELVKAAPDTRITLKADGELPANSMVRFTQVLYEAGVKTLRLLAEAEA
ncbi:biopolymer transporter ExbD [Allohahella marinimesophila]